MILQGPHQEAQKSTRTGPRAFLMVSSNVASLRCTIRGPAMSPPRRSGKENHHSTRLPPFARRRFGQNFLVSRSAIGRIVDALDPRPDERVIEIGPGRGALTARLLERVPSLTAIEIDRDLVAFLRASFDPGRLRVLEGDVLDLWERRDALHPPFVVAGNLPYAISKPLAMKLVASRSDVL